MSPAGFTRLAQPGELVHYGLGFKFQGLAWFRGLGSASRRF